MWGLMINRCHCPTSNNFENYGARGISVCAAWRSSFEAFRDHMPPRPSRKHSLGRIDNDGDYKPGNVEWQTHTQQMNNKRNNHLVRLNGETMTLAQSARLLGISFSAAEKRVKRHGSVVLPT
ncbi:MAG: hypothetical protein EOP03_00370 [Proteobacteria bacterium]|nr:MAG: hypothetical protein EOP03_00370 [Pseudomonadota bacterium]